MIIILFLALILRLVLANFGTLSLDHNTFIAWSTVLVSGGLKNFYNSWSDYLPGYLYILWVLGKINSLGIINQSILFKLPAIIADIATGGLIYTIVKQIKNEKWALVFAGLYVFNPAIFANSSLWGQVDSLTALFSILAVYLASQESKYSMYGSVAALVAGTLIKPQAAYAAPVVFYLMIRDKWQVKKIITYIIVGTLLFVVGFIPFNNESNLFVFIWNRILQTVNQYPYTSINAFNFWGFQGLWKPDNTLGLAFLVPLIAVIVTYFKLKKEKYDEYLLLAISLITSFMFLTRMHERHLLPALAPILIAAALNPLVLVSYFGLSFTYLLNLNYSFVWITNNFKSIYSNVVIKIILIFNMIFTSVLFYSLFKKVKEFNFSFLLKWKSQVVEETFPEIKKFKINTKISRFILVGILFFAFAARVLFLSNPAKEYFDEVYHAFTARVMLHSDPKAWEWWNTPPEGFAYEWTHPPLAKEIMVVGMAIFGENSFGWRIPAAIFGTGSVFLVYLIAKRLFNDEILALTAAGVLSLDGLTLVLNRIGMNDTYFLFFALLSIYFFLKEKDLFSAAALGLAASSKWTVFWVVPILGVIFLSLRRKIKLSLIWFVVLPTLIYLASYIPMFLVGNHTWETFTGVQKQMWWYHTNLKATHAYSSAWWGWPFLVRPVWLYTSGVVDKLVGNIYAIGNPFVFWFGITAVAGSAYWAFKAANKKLGIVIFAYLAFFAPWALSPRIMFMYHYLPSIPFLAIASAYVLRKFPKLIPVYFAVGLLVFIYFYPHWTGIKVPVWLDNSYYWIKSWR